MGIIREMFEDMPIIMGFFSLIIGVFLLFVVDFFAGHETYYSGIVIDKHYKPKVISTGTGVGMTASGKTGVIMTSNHESEEFLMMVKFHTGVIVTAKSKPEIYYSKELSDSVKVRVWHGGFTDNAWSIKATQ